MDLKRDPSCPHIAMCGRDGPLSILLGNYFISENVNAVKCNYCICSSCLAIICFTISPPIEPACLEVKSPL